MALAHQVGELSHHGLAHRHVLVATVEREHVPAEVDLAVEVLLERAHDQVARPRQLGGDLVGELDLLAGHYGVSASCTAELTRRPSARPFTWGMISAMTLPISLGELAPDDATASPTMACRSSSESCSGR